MEEQQKKKNNKKLFLVIGVCALLVGMFILLNTYAFWRIKGEQSESNYVVGACLNFEFVELEDENGKIGGFTLEGDKAMPISDEEGTTTTGYTFKIENTCDKAVDYQVVLESLKIVNPETSAYYPNEKYFSDDKIKIQLDNGAIKTYNKYDEVDADSEADPDELRITRQLLVGSLPGKSEDENDTSNIATHNLKMWITEESTNDDIGKLFRSKIKVFAGQGVPEADYAITPESCFDFDSETGTVTGFHSNDEICMNNPLIMPATINGQIIKKIAISQSPDFSYVNLSNMTGLEEIGSGSFRNYHSWGGTKHDLGIPDTVKTIGATAFYNYQAERFTLIIPDSVEYIGNSAFYNFISEKVILGSNVKTIGTSAFYSYRGINSSTGFRNELVIPNSVTEIKDSAFSRFDGSQLTLGNSLETIGTQAFYFYKGIGNNSEKLNLVIPGNVKSVGLGAFYAFEGQSITFEDGVERIMKQAFYDYNGDNITIPSSVTGMGTGAFHSMDSSKIIYIDSPTKPSYYDVSDWHGQATVKCLDGNRPIDCQ